MIPAPRRAPLSVELLLFTAGGIRLGLERGRIAAMVTLAEARRRGVVPIDPHALLGLACQTQRSDSRVLLLKGSPPAGVIIDGPDEFFPAEASAVLPLPRLLRTDGNQAIRGVLLKDRELVLLADFRRTRAL